MSSKDIRIQFLKIKLKIPSLNIPIYNGVGYIIVLNFIKTFHNFTILQDVEINFVKVKPQIFMGNFYISNQIFSLLVKNHKSLQLIKNTTSKRITSTYLYYILKHFNE